MSFRSFSTTFLPFPSSPFFQFPIFCLCSALTGRIRIHGVTCTNITVSCWVPTILMGTLRCVIQSTSCPWNPERKSISRGGKRFLLSVQENYSSFKSNLSISGAKLFWTFLPMGHSVTRTVFVTAEAFIIFLCYFFLFLSPVFLITPSNNKTVVLVKILRNIIVWHDVRLNSWIKHLI